MKNNKFSIKTIEEGRMEGGEMKQLYGGTCNPYSCPSGYACEICFNIYRACDGPYQYCDDTARESCGGGFTITVPIPFANA